MTPALLLILLLKAASPTREADAAFADAKAARTALKADPEKRKFRHHWQNVGKKLEAAAARYGSGPHAVEALTLASQTYEELSRFSGNKEDVEASERMAKKAKDLSGSDAQVSAGARSASKSKDSNERSAPKQKNSSDPSTHKSKDHSPKEVAERPSAKPGDTAAEKTASKTNQPSILEKASARSSESTSEKSPGKSKAASKDLLASAKAAATAPKSKADAQVGRIAEAFKKFDLPELEGRRAPPAHARPATEEDDTAATPDDEPAGMRLPSIEEIQERLRDVRVGQRDVAALKQAGKEGDTSGLTLAEQLGLKVKRVIIDAGHGGHDTGAVGKNGTLEKDVALSIAQKLAKRLREAGLEVLMTRDDDTFVKLEDRTRFANQHKGDLFISVHCNSAVSNQLRGVETYTLNTSSDRYSIRLAARENASTERGVGDLQLILADLATKANTEEGTRLAKRVQREMVAGLKEKNPSVRDLGHKEALFFVLLGAKMPAILVETSFLSNPVEEKLLAADGYQDDAADAIAEGVRGFLEERSRIAQVD